MTKGNIYRVIDLARMFAVHPNTIRLYEKLSYISKAQRSKNGYREFTELHVLQLQICRKIFGYPFTKRAIRKTGDALLHAIAKQDWQMSHRRYEEYIAAIKNEIQLAEQAGKYYWIGAIHQTRKMTTQKRKDITEKKSLKFLG
ncbi:MerR family DNA-binding transcriptional regulator [Enterococcus avium]|uniref:MerR family DNA-binding transcriptional regulator n=1 Tax=Enterococcus avium TaxID=33945 RepID=UPI00232DD01A|nr:MerR family DNA-binding transcriptional regulator [Enterococcus avium]MDB1748153.1 MerR family DNA-binding transcriptional regulator [Enterococcus avium]MDB1752356.1 MerR family DNA-binding transcriptional regulator [Enterococcus avium]MDB1759405.1 MerR family DNA-binding transcriptional regulator [Enterococcus avium]